MTEAEHSEAIRFAIERVNHRIPVIAGTGSNCTRTAIELSREAEKDGADGLLLVTPYYNKATQNGLIAHYTQICNEVQIRRSSTMCQAVPDVPSSRRLWRHL